ncbi:hypothetical protein BGZ83_010407 [Gryganskiella cystojenkinii]|nr:hypothetical protein BGZ83_010407 [Gryganskiella cystojenkinii]
MAEQELKCKVTRSTSTDLEKEHHKLTPLTTNLLHLTQGNLAAYIFCVRCANKGFEAALVCPACETTLTQPDDIVFVDLNPSQEYRSSILSGLRPEIVMDICTRAISFWTYQTAQEARFQELAQRNLEDNHCAVERQLQKMTREVNLELAALQKDLEQEKRKAAHLNEQLDEKSRQLTKVQTLYDRQKRRPLFPALEQQSQQQQQQQPFLPLGAQPASSTYGWNNPYSLYHTPVVMRGPTGMNAGIIPVVEPPSYPAYQPLGALVSSPMLAPQKPHPIPNSLFSPRRMGPPYPGQAVGQRLNTGPRP